MTAKVIRPAIAFTTVIALLAAALAVYAFLSAGNSHADSVYNPVTTVKLCNDMDPAFNSTVPGFQPGTPPCTENKTAGAHPDFTTVLHNDSGDLNFSNVITLAPNAFTIGTGAPTGTLMGGLLSSSTLGLAGNPCNNIVPVAFKLWNVALPSNLAAPRSSTNIAFPQAPGTTARFDHWKVGSVATGADPGIASGDGVTADAANIPINNYPSYLLDLFDEDYDPIAATGGTAHIHVPIAVYGGLTLVSGQWIPLFFAQFASGNLATNMGGGGLDEPLKSINAAMGQPSVSVLNDPSVAKGATSSINDFCTPLTVTTTLLGNPSGNVRFTNPANGTYFFMQYNASLRDTDQDGYENALDPCTLKADPASDPRTGANDADPGGGDGLPDSCDATIALDVDKDADNDTFQNRQDNCPTVANGTGGTSIPPNPAGLPGDFNTDSDIGTAAADKGPRTDAIGDSCDGRAGVTDWPTSLTITQNGSSVTIAMSSTVANGRYMSKTNNVAKCIGLADVDGDGYCAGAGELDTNAVRHNIWNGATYTSLLQMDTDGDGFSDAQETYMGTDPTKPCAQTAAGNNETPLDNWPYDLDDNQTAALTDVTKFKFGDVNVPPASVRFDLNDDGQVSLTDVTKYGAVFNKKCGSAGTLGIPDWAQQ